MCTKIKILLYFIGLIAVFIFIVIITNLNRLKPNTINIVNIPKQEQEKNIDIFANESIYKKTITTLFWIGENSDSSNGFIPNHQSYWDSYWVEHYGGVDSPNNRCGYYPCGFTPKENPFYFALPYGDRSDDGNQKASTKLIPWYIEAIQNGSLIKNTWIEIKYGDKTCYAQWEDVGPFETDDFDYVFGNAKPQNTFGVSAGLDISPATWDCLGLDDNFETSWRFIEEKDVPEGPWKLITTGSGISF